MSDPNVAAEIRALTAAYERARAAVERLDPRDSFIAATQLRDQLTRLESQAALLRARQAERIWVAENLSLAELADAIKMSRARADQFLRWAQGREVKGPGKSSED